MEVLVPEFREKILQVEEKLASIPGAMLGDCFPLKHTFVDGMYLREISVPKGSLVVTKIHKMNHPCFILKGDCSVFSEEGPKRIRAPYYMVTPAGTKRIVYVHEDTVWVTVHKTDETDLKKIEEEIITKTFDEILFDVQKFRELTKIVIAHEKDGFWNDWTPEQQRLYVSGDWESFSRSRGYSEQEIHDFKLWINIKEDAEKRGLNPIDMIRDLTINASARNIKKDKKGEILLSSHIPMSKQKGDSL